MKKKVVFACKTILSEGIKNKLEKLFKLEVVSCDFAEEDALKVFGDANGIIMCSEGKVTKNISEKISPEWIIVFADDPRIVFDDYSWVKFKEKVYSTGFPIEKIIEKTEEQIIMFLKSGELKERDVNITVLGNGSVEKGLMQRLCYRYDRVFYSGGKGGKDDSNSIGFGYLSPKKAFKVSRVVSVHTKCFPVEMGELVKKDFLLSMPRDALFLNSAGADLIDFFDLKSVLEQKSDLLIVFDDYYSGRDPTELSDYRNFVYAKDSKIDDEKFFSHCYKRLFEIVQENKLN